MDHYLFSFEAPSEDEKNILVALLDNIGFEGFEEDASSLKAFIPEEKFDQKLFDSIIEIKNIKYLKSIVKETNWNEAWEKGFDPVVIFDQENNTPLVSIRAIFHAPVPDIPYDLVITPKMSFGTGHHATTYLMIREMCQMDFKDKTVIDFGTGTAVLAILAEKLGAANVIAIDNDDWSINNAKDNIAINHCNKINLVKAETVDASFKADIILANINLNIILANLTALRAVSYRGTNILFSGIMSADESQIMAALKENGFEVHRYYSRDNWLIIWAIVQ